MVTVCSLLLLARAVPVVDAAAVAVASSAVLRDAAVAAVNPVARVVVAAKAVASSVAVDVVVRDVDVARLVAVEAAVATSPAPTLPTPALSPAWAHRLLQLS
jgi:hypothetical protein